MSTIERTTSNYFTKNTVILDKMNGLCCLCLTESSNCTTIDNENNEICEKIQTCLQLKIHFNNAKSATICFDCIGQLHITHAFSTKIHNAHLSESVKMQLNLTPCGQETKILTIRHDNLNVNNNNNCLENLQDSELDIKDEPLDDSKELDNESCEEDVHGNDNSTTDEETKKPNALATIKSWKNYPWYCYLCIYSTLNFTTLMEHLKSKHDISTSKKMQYQCVDCTKKLSNYALFLNHVRLEHQTELKLSCDVCSEHFNDYDQLAAHRREHKEKANVQQPFVFHCNHCWKVYPSRQSINKHVLSHDKGLQCQNCDKSFKCLKYLKRHMEMHAELKHKCDFCEKTFHRKFNKINHERTHTGERPYKCDQCDKMFSFQSTLKSHQRTHTGELPYNCDQCTAKFRHYDSLKEHKRKHSKESPFSCSQCDESFRYRKSLNRHMRLHKKVPLKIKLSKTSKVLKKTTSRAGLKNAARKPRQAKTSKPT